MKALVLGYGISGKAAEKNLKEKGYEVDVAEGYDLVVASPAIVVKSELQLGVEKLLSQGVKLLAVTGSKGKSSVVKLVAEALNLSGRKAVACGNYGLAVCDVEDCEWAVVEVSSFQLETTSLAPGTFEAATVLNYQEDHLDRHGSVELYHALKRRLLTMAKIAVETCDEANDAPLLEGSYFDNPILRSNGCRAIALLRTAGLKDSEIREAFLKFEPLAHRMNEIGVFRGVKCIDDSKATSLAAMAAAIEMVKGPVRLIAGGRAKGDNPKIVKELLTKRVKKVYLIGECSNAFFEAWFKDVDCEICGTLDNAVKSAFNEAEVGETLLLSPGTASYDQFKNYSERGEKFAFWVKQEGK